MTYYFTALWIFLNVLGGQSQYHREHQIEEPSIDDLIEVLENDCVIYAVMDRLSLYLNIWPVILPLTPKLYESSAKRSASFGYLQIDTKNKLIKDKYQDGKSNKYGDGARHKQEVSGVLLNHLEMILRLLLIAKLEL